MKSKVMIDRRFCGPPDSGNGGYVCGLTAGYLSGEVEVTLRQPPPLDTPLDVEMTGGDQVRLVGKSGLVAEGRGSIVECEIPFRPSFEQARSAAEHYSGFDDHFYPTCFVCGPDRQSGDGLRIFAGPLKGTDAVAAPWVPDPSLADASGRTSAKFVWAALDCPGYFAVNQNRHRYMLLGRMAATVVRLPRTNERCIVAGWHIGTEGRKHFAATVLFSEGGNLLGKARATWIETKPPS